MYKKKEKKRQRITRKDWNNHNRLGTDCTQINASLRWCRGGARSIIHSILTYKLLLIKIDQGFVAIYQTCWHNPHKNENS